MPILVCLQKILSDFRTIRGKRNFSSRTDVFLKSQSFSKSMFNLACFDTKFGSKNFASGLMAGKFGKFGLKTLFVSCVFIVCVAEAPADHESLWM